MQREAVLPAVGQTPTVGCSTDRSAGRCFTILQIVQFWEQDIPLVTKLLLNICELRIAVLYFSRSMFVVLFVPEHFHTAAFLCGNDTELCCHLPVCTEWCCGI